jgi:hypothetical protein
MTLGGHQPTRPGTKISPERITKLTRTQTALTSAFLA